jgi:hypothetical protein
MRVINTGGGRGTHFKKKKKKKKKKKDHKTKKQSKVNQTNKKAEKKKGFCRPVLVTAAAVVTECLTTDVS